MESVRSAQGPVTGPRKVSATAIMICARHRSIPAILPGFASCPVRPWLDTVAGLPGCRHGQPKDAHDPEPVSDVPRGDFVARRQRAHPKRGKDDGGLPRRHDSGLCFCLETGSSSRTRATTTTDGSCGEPEASIGRCYCQQSRRRRALHLKAMERRKRHEQRVGVYGSGVFMPARSFY